MAVRIKYVKDYLGQIKPYGRATEYGRDRKLTDNQPNASEY